MPVLLKETEKILERHGKTLDDIVFFGVPGAWQMTREDFEIEANKQYDAGFGEEEVCTRLKLVGKDFWLERNSYDGNEWWEFKKLPPIEDTPFCSEPASKFQDDRKHLLWSGWRSEFDMEEYI